MSRPRGADRSGPGPGGRMQEEANWSMQLSGGEQQRVASRAPCCMRRTGCSWTRPPPRWMSRPRRHSWRSCRSAAVHHRGEHRTPAGDVRTPRSHAGDPARRRWSRAPGLGTVTGGGLRASALEARSARAVDRAQLAPRKAQRAGPARRHLRIRVAQHHRGLRHAMLARPNACRAHTLACTASRNASADSSLLKMPSEMALRVGPSASTT